MLHSDATIYIDIKNNLDIIIGQPSGENSMLLFILPHH